MIAYSKLCQTSLDVHIVNERFDVAGEAGPEPRPNRAIVYSLILVQEGSP